MNEFANRLLAELVKENDEINFLIDRGTEMNRMGFAHIQLLDADKKPVKGARVRVKQAGHEYLFGCNAFMLNQFPEAEQNAQYVETFTKLFNEAVIPFYWSDFEPEDGNPRFSRDSKPVYRRPNTEECLEFCEKYHVTPKGHPLCWHCFLPEWLPQNSEALMERLERRIREIADYCGNRIRIWDAVNEAQTRMPLFSQGKVSQHLPDDYVERVFKIADRYMPSASLLYNDNLRWWSIEGDYSPVILMIRWLLARGCRVNGLGLQFHMFDHYLQDSERLIDLTGSYRAFLNPKSMYSCLDQYAKLNIPVNMSEVSIVSRRDLGDGDAFQELVTEKMYRLWFSHPATNSIVWWNLVDGTAAYAPPGSEEGENSLRAGLVNYNFSPKSAYKALDRLINREWRTNTTFEYEAGKNNMFHGFYGDYDLEIKTDCGVFFKKLKFSKNSGKTYQILLDK